MNFGSKLPDCFWEKKFNIEIWVTSDQGQKNDLDLWYSLNFINSFNWIFQATLRPKDAMVSEK